MDKGWVSLHREILDGDLIKNHQAFSLWCYLLLRANWQDTEKLIGNQSIAIKRGQFLAGRKKLSEATGIQESKVERLLKAFEKQKKIEQQTFTKYRLISIVNYDKYQDNEQQANNKRTASEQQVNTDNKGIIKQGNNKRGKFSPPSLNDVEDYFKSKGLNNSKSHLEADKFINHYGANGWKVGKNKMQSWKHAASGWLSRIKDYEKTPRYDNSKSPAQRTAEAIQAEFGSGEFS